MTLVRKAGPDSIFIGGGDMNSRVGDIKQKIPLSNAFYRINPDNLVNAHGRMLKKVCSASKCFVLNNMTIGNLELDGRFTYYKGVGKSQNDLCVSNEEGLRNIDNLMIHNIGWNFSDHLPISIQCKFNLYDSDIDRKASIDILFEIDNEEKRPKRILDNAVNWDGYTTIAVTELGILRREIDGLQDMPSNDKLNEVLESVSQCLYNSAQTCSGFKPREHLLVPPVNSVLGNADSAFQLFCEGNIVREEWEIIRQEAVHSMGSARYKEEVVKWNKVLKCADAKELWYSIDWASKSDVRIGEDGPTADELAEQFKLKGSGEEDDLLKINAERTNYVPVLDEPITLEEIHAAANKLKEGKSTCDGWVPRMIKSIPHILFPILLAIFNVIMSCSVFPEIWWKATVAAIFKNKGLKRFASNYRPVALVFMLSKFFDFILLRRFMEWFKPHDNQTAYQKMRGCADHIFLLRCMSENIKKEKGNFFISAIDFDGAFDRVKRSTLVKKLILFGAGSYFISCIINMYRWSEYTIYKDNCYARYLLQNGIKQGLPLSPMLFLFYIDDIHNFFDALFMNSTIYNQLHALIHADDATILATSRDMMLSKLKTLATYCKLNSIVLQVSKCHFIVINGSEEDKKPFQITDKVGIKHQESLDILGSPITGNLKTDLELHLKKRFKNVIKFYGYLKDNRFAPLTIKLKVLRACVLTTLLYNCETFGHKLPDGLEELYFKLLKATLNVRQSTPNSIILVEAGFLPLKALVYCRQLKFYQRFKNSLAQNSPRHRVFQHILDNEQRSEFIQHYMDLEVKYINVKAIKVEFFQNLKNGICDQSNYDSHYKHWIYMQINPMLHQSPFLHLPGHTAHCIAKFRLGSHNLEIEKGRWTRVEREGRVCKECGVLGDELHLFYQCININRSDMHNLPPIMANIWADTDLTFKLFREIIKAKYVEY